MTDLGQELRSISKLCPDPKWKFRIYLASLVLSFASFMIILQGMIGESLEFISPSCENVYFSPRTSIAFDVSGLYCGKLTIKKYQDNSPSSQWNTSLYLLHQMPNLSTRYNFTISENITLSPYKFYKWSFYLHEGSSYTIKACIVNGTDSNVCIIGGDNNLNDWIRTRSCEHPHSIEICDTSRLVNTTYSGVIKEANTYYFVYSTQIEIETSLQVEMAFISYEYSINQSDIFDECEILDQSCSINVPTYFRGVAVLATSGTINEPTVWEDTLLISWECEASINFFEIHMFLPAAVSVSLFFLWLLLLVCMARYCDAQRTKKWVTIIIVIIAIAGIVICLSLNILGTQNVNKAFTWSCTPVNAKLELIFYVPLHILMGFVILLGSMIFIKQQQDSDQKPPTRQVVPQKHDNRPSTKRIIIIATIITTIMAPIVAATFTFLEAVLPIFALYSTPVNILTPGDTKIIPFKNFFVSGVFIDYIGSPHLSATLYVSDEQPPLSNFTSYNTSESLLCNQSECTHTWQSYLNQQSSVNIQICLNESSSSNASFYIIKGVKSDTSDSSQIHVEPGNHQLNYSLLTQSNQCFEWILHIDTHALSTDRYFFILKEYNNSIVDVNLHFNRTDYSPKYTNTSNVDSCTINSHTINRCTAHLQKRNLLCSSTALIVVTSNLDKPLFEWQETMALTIGYKYRADTWTILWLPVFVINNIGSSLFILLCIKLRLKLLNPAKPKSDPITIIAQNKIRISKDDQELNEQISSMQRDSLPQNADGSTCNNDTDGDDSFPTVTNVPATIETSQSFVVSVEINPESDTTAAANTDNEYTNNNVSSNPSVEALHSPAIIGEANCIQFDAEQKDANEVTLSAAMQKPDLDEPIEHPHSEQLL